MNLKNDLNCHGLFHFDSHIDYSEYRSLIFIRSQLLFIEVSHKLGHKILWGDISFGCIMHPQNSCVEVLTHTSSNVVRGNETIGHTHIFLNWEQRSSLKRTRLKGCRKIPSVFLYHNSEITVFKRKAIHLSWHLSLVEMHLHLDWTQVCLRGALEEIHAII